MQTIIKCNYCNKPRKYITDMLSNSYHICNKCSTKHFNQHYKTLQTMKQKYAIHNQ